MSWSKRSCVPWLTAAIWPLLFHCVTPVLRSAHTGLLVIFPAWQAPYHLRVLHFLPFLPGILFVIFHFYLFIYGLSLWGRLLLKWLMISAFCYLFVPLCKFPLSWVSVGPSNSFLMNSISKSNGIWLQK